MATIEQKELEGHRSEIIADVKILVEKYRAMLAQRTAAELAGTAAPKLGHDSSTNTLIRRYRRLREA